MKHKSFVVLYLLFSAFAAGCKKHGVLKNELVVSGKDGKYIVTPANGDWMVEISHNDNLLSINSSKPGVSSCAMVVRELEEKNSISFLMIDNKQNTKVLVTDGEITQIPADK